MISRALAILAFGVLALGVVCAGAAEKRLLIESEVEGGHLFLRYGIAKHYYYKIGDRHGGTSGENAEMYAQKKWPGTQYMDEHPGDWCGFVIQVDQDKTLVIDGDTRIGIEMADGTVVQSDAILILGDMAEDSIGNAAISHLYLSGDLNASRYARSPNPRFFGAYGLYVRFPEGSCLSDQADGIERYFKSKPVRLSMLGSHVAKGGD